MDGQLTTNPPALVGLLAQNAPRLLSREGRVALLADVAGALLDRRVPSREAALSAGSARIYQRRQSTLS